MKDTQSLRELKLISELKKIKIQNDKLIKMIYVLLEKL